MHKNTIVRLIYKLFSQTFGFLKKYYYESKTPKEEEDPEASGRGLALVARLTMRAHTCTKAEKLPTLPTPYLQPSE